jgi:hypothetical protein
MNEPNQVLNTLKGGVAQENDNLIMNVNSSR